MATTKAATALAVGDILAGPIAGEILEVSLVLDSPYYPEGYVDALVAFPRPTSQGATRRWEAFQLDDQVRVA